VRDERQMVRALQSIFASDVVRLRASSLRPTIDQVQTLVRNLQRLCADNGWQIIRVKDKSSDPLVPGVTFIVEAMVDGVLVRIEVQAVF